MLRFKGSSIDGFLDNFSFSTLFKLEINYLREFSSSSYFKSSDNSLSELFDYFLLLEEIDEIIYECDSI